MKKLVASSLGICGNSAGGGDALGRRKNGDLSVLVAERLDRFSVPILAKKKESFTEVYSSAGLGVWPSA